MSKCYYKGIFYPNEEEFFKGVRFFDGSPVNDESIDILLKQFEANIKANIFMTRIEERISNLKFNIILDQALEFILMKAYEMKD